MKQVLIASLIALAIGAGIGLVIGADATQGERVMILAGAVGVAVAWLNWK